nr:MAG TPA: hypothetical protein [Caudoviricetes sp.]
MQCLEENNTFEIAKIERNLSLKNILSVEVSSIQRGDDEIVKVIFLIVKRFCELINVGKNLNEDQQIQLAFDLQEYFIGDSLEDIMLFFKKARKGEFGEFYRLDSAVILSWVPLYLDQKAAERERVITNERNIRARRENDAVAINEMSPESVIRFKELSKRLNQMKEKQSEIINADNPLQNYGAYLKQLPNIVKNLKAKDLKNLLKNTSKYSYSEAYNVLLNEVNRRGLKI